MKRNRYRVSVLGAVWLLCSCAPAQPTVPHVNVNPNGLAQRLTFMSSGTLRPAPPSASSTAPIRFR